jgi:hypothetical protein
VLWRGRCEERVLYAGEVRGVELWNRKRPAAAVSHEPVQYLHERHGDGEVRSGEASNWKQPTAVVFD